MKKVILFVSMAISVICATNQNLSEEVAKENQLGQNLKLDVKVTIPKEIVKYAVYSTNDKERTIKDTLSLPVFYLTQDSTKAGFQQGAEIPTVYTRIVRNGEVDTVTNVNATYILTHPDGFFPNNVANATLGPQGSVLFILPTSLLSKEKLEGIVSELNKTGSGKNYFLSSTGSICKGSATQGSPRYAPAAMIKFHNYQGVLTVKSEPYNENYKLPAEDIAKIESLLAGEIPIAEGVHFVVKVE